MTQHTTHKTLLRPEGLVQSPAFTHVAVVPPGATTVVVMRVAGLAVPGALVEVSAVAAVAS